VSADILCDFADVIFGYRQGLIAVLHHAYFDESGTHDGAPIMSFGAYLFTADQARKFSRDWAKDLKRLGLPYAHMTDCALGFAAYKDMSMEERVQSEKLLITHIKRRSLFGFMISAPKLTYEQETAGLRLVSLYTFLLQMSVIKIRDIAQAKGIKQIAYFFESGHRFANEANALFNQMAEVPRAAKWFLYAGHAFVDKRNVLPLQAADMLAWQENHRRTRELQGHNKIRADFRALMRDNIDYFAEVQRSDIDQLVERRRRGFLLKSEFPPELVEGLDFEAIQLAP